MGKQAFNQRSALANALNTTGKAVAAPPVKEKERPEAKKPVQKKVKDEPQDPELTKKDIEEAQRRQLEENERKRAAFYAEEAAKKVMERKSADTAVTYIEDKDSRKPKAVGDISEYWAKDMGALPFLPSDNPAATLGDPEQEGIDPHERLVYLMKLSEQLLQLLRLRFHIFWSQVIYDKSLRRCIDSYLRFCLRSHDLPGVDGAEQVVPANGIEDVLQEEQRVTREISRRMLAILVRLSRPQETSHDYVSSQWYGEMIRDHAIFDVPKLIDVCAIYGDSNRETVTKLVHSVFSNQPSFKDDFKEVVQHILGGLHQCCAPLQQAAKGGGKADLSVEECLAFLPDILSCFNAIFCFFPEECVESLLGGSFDASSQTNGESVSVPLAELMVQVHDGVSALESRAGDAAASAEQFVAVRSLLSRLLSLTLGFKMAPRRGAGAFTELLEWLRAQHQRTSLLNDLGRYGLENVAMEWMASGLVDDAQLDFLEELCGPVLGAEARTSAKRRARAVAASAGSGAAGATASSSSTGRPTAAGKPATSASSSDAAKIREVREVVGNEFGDGFVLQCLLHYGSSVPAVVGAILDGSLPPQLLALPITMKIGDEFEQAGPDAPTLHRALTDDDKSRTLAAAGRMLDRQAAAADEEEYNDDFDDMEDLGGARLNVGGNSDLDESDEDDRASQSSGEEGNDRWAGRNRGKGGKFKGGKGGYGGRGKGGPVQGQTIQARRKEENKSSVANHNRKRGADNKMRKAGMF